MVFVSIAEKKIVSNIANFYDKSAAFNKLNIFAKKLDFWPVGS
jgi:hypothetical protein